MSTLPKLIVVLGVTASGKTSLAIKLAKKFNGEIVSADSRQVYKEFNIGTAKPQGRWMQLGNQRVFMVNGIPHYLMDVIDPKEEFTLDDYKNLALGKISGIINNDKIPFLVGGTALYIKAICENWSIPKVKPNLALRNKLEHKSSAELFAELRKKDPEAALITGSKNKRRIVRALEVILVTNRKFSEQRKKGGALFDILKLGVKIDKDAHVKNLAKRIGEMIKEGLIKEIKSLHQKYSWSLIPMQSIDYQEFKDYFEQKKSLTETLKVVNQHHVAFSKRQMTWFKKDKTIHWIQSESEAIDLIKTFLQS